jgi:O-antigen/teichoic acid export membrane protein
MELLACSAIVESVVKVGLGIVALELGYGLAAVVLLTVAGRALACLVATFLLGRCGIRVRFGSDLAMLRKLTAAAPTFLLIAVFATLYWRIDVFMLSRMRPVEDVGYYGAAWRLLELALIVPQSFCLALYPQLAAAVRTDRSEVLRIGRTALRYLTALSLPVAVCVTVLSGPMLALLYGPDFRQAGATLSILMWTLVPYGWVRHHAYVLVAADRQRVDLALNILMTAVNVGLNLVLIPTYGPLGAAVATLVSVVTYAIAQYLYLATSLRGYAAPIVVEPLPALGSILAGVIAWLLRDHGPLLPIAVVPPVYFLLLIASGFFTTTELRVLRLERFAARLAPFRNAG